MPTVPLERHLLRARDLADSHYDEPLDLRALAREAHVSPRHFSRTFRRVFGETPHQYLLTRRLERARHLLRTTGMSVAEICLEVGFTSVGSFTTTFRRHVGVSPTTFRNAYAAPRTPTASHSASRWPGPGALPLARFEKTAAPSAD